VKLPLSELNDVVPDVPVGAVAVTVISTDTVFAVAELSLTTTLVVPAPTPVIDNVEPLIAAVATVEVGAV